MATKKVSLTADFMAAAAADQEGALAYMLMSAFGISLLELCQIAESMIVNGETALMNMALAAGVQIRGNVVFVGDDFANIKERYPSLIIEGDRDQDDKYNFSALHCLGHILAHWSAHPLGSKILKKAGSCITGQDTTKNAAGEINSEISKSWSPDDVMKFQNINMSQKYAPVLSKIFENVMAKAVAFRNVVKPPPAAPSATKSSTIDTSTMSSTPPGGKTEPKKGS